MVDLFYFTLFIFYLFLNFDWMILVVYRILNLDKYFIKGSASRFPILALTIYQPKRPNLTQAQLKIEAKLHESMTRTIRAVNESLANGYSLQTERIQAL